MHKVLENAVYLYLIQKGYTVYIGKIGDKEIDFVANKDGKKLYVQVCLTLNSSPETAGREFGNLLEIGDNYPKYLITLNDMIIGKDYKGIIQLNLADFITGEF